MEMFQGVLTLYYSVEVCHLLRGKDFNNMQQIVGDMVTAWESRPYSERTKMHRTAAERTFNNRRQLWTRPRDAQPIEGTGGCLTRGKGRGELTGSEGVWTKDVTLGSQDVPAPSKNLLCHYCKLPGHYKTNCPNLKSKLGMINLESESEEDKALHRIGTIDGKLCRC